MSSKSFIAMGFRGKLDNLGVNTLDNYKDKDRQIRESGKGHPLFTPLVELNPRQEPLSVSAQDVQELTERIQEGYTNLCQGDPNVFYPGPFGDFLQVFKTEPENYIYTVGHKAFPKPGLAADLAVIVKSPSESEQKHNYHLVTGIRKAPPGKGRPALFGGFRNIERNADGQFQFDSGAYTMLHEAIEEAGLKIEHNNPNYLKTAYTIPEVQVKVTLRDTQHSCTMHYLDTISTSDKPLDQGGESLPNGEKRVYATDAYMVMVELDKRIKYSYLQSVLRGGDDIHSLDIFNISKEVEANDPQTLQKRIGFGIEHHNHFLPLIVERLHSDM